jgi:hypothetical protein
LPTTATLEILLESEAPRGVLIIYLGTEQLLREDFRFGGGFLRRSGEGGTLRRTKTVPAGAAALRIFVTTRSGQPAVVQELNGNFLGGSQRTLVIQVDGEGEVEVHLQ